MDPQQRRAAMEDLLEYCRGRHHQLDVGRQLATVLIGSDSNGGEDDWRLKDAMEEILAEELQSYRTRFGVKDPVGDAVEAHLASIKNDLKPRQKALFQRSVMWAYYVCSLSAEQIGHACGLTATSIHNYRREGLHQVEQAIARREAQRPRQQPRTSAADPPLPTINPPPTVPQRRNYREQLLMVALAILSLAVGNLVIRTAPRVSATILLTFGAWRFAVHGWGIYRHWARRDREIRTWYLLFAGCWLALCAWALAMLVYVRGGVLPPDLDLLLERLTWSSTLVTVSAGMFFLGALDLLLRINTLPAHEWPWSLLKPYALTTWEQRWPLLGCCWLIVVVAGVVHLGPRLSLIG